MKRRAVRPVRIRRSFDQKIRFCENLVCRNGHDFGLNRERCVAFYGRVPESVPCAFCGTRVPLKASA